MFCKVPGSINSNTKSSLSLCQSQMHAHTGTMYYCASWVQCSNPHLSVPHQKCEEQRAALCTLTYFTAEPLRCFKLREISEPFPVQGIINAHVVLMWIFEALETSFHQQCSLKWFEHPPALVKIPKNRSILENRICRIKSNFIYMALFIQSV